MISIRCIGPWYMPATPDSTTALFEAISNGDLHAVRSMLVATPTLVALQDEQGLTPLMRAVSSMRRTPELVRMLIDAGADVNAAVDGCTALHFMTDVNGATGSGAMPGKIARILADGGADIEARQQWGWTPLMRAAIEGSADELRALVDVGGNVNHRFPAHTMPEFLRGCTTLMATVGYPDKLQILIAAGADLLAKDSYDRTVLEYAHECLAEAVCEHAHPRVLAQELAEQTTADMVRMMTELGIDPQNAVEPTGKTWLEMIQEQQAVTFSSLSGIDYAGDVRKSIAIIKSALGLHS
jgi:hypothetical protein